MKVVFNKGQNLVEFALVLPVLIVLLLGIMEFGMIFNAQLTLENAAREGARFGTIQSRNDVQIKDRVIATTMGLTLNRENVTVSKDLDKITVVVTYRFNLFDPVISSILGTRIELRGNAAMSLE